MIALARCDTRDRDTHNPPQDALDLDRAATLAETVATDLYNLAAVLMPPLADDLRAHAEAIDGIARRMVAQARTLAATLS